MGLFRILSFLFKNSGSIHTAMSLAKKQIYKYQQGFEGKSEAELFALLAQKTKENGVETGIKDHLNLSSAVKGIKNTAQVPQHLIISIAVTKELERRGYNKAQIKEKLETNKDAF